MANPRQRRKARSGTGKVRQSKRQQDRLKKVVISRAPKVIAEAWDKKKTPRQNFHALGLATSENLLINGPSGGIEASTSNTPIPYAFQKRRLAGFDFEDLPEEEEGVDGNGLEATGDVKFGRIIRDEEGRVIRVEIDGEEDEKEDEEITPWGRPIDSGISQLEDQTKNIINGFSENNKDQSDFLNTLDELSNKVVKKDRFTSTAEKEWLRELIKIHGDDYKAMERDVKRNRGLKTAGEIRRAIKKGGGKDVLLNL